MCPESVAGGLADGERVSGASPSSARPVPREVPEVFVTAGFDALATRGSHRNQRPSVRSTTCRTFQCCLSGPEREARSWRILRPSVWVGST